MKKLVFFAALVMITTVSFSQTAAVTSAPKSEMAVANFDTQNFDFGKIKVGVPATHEFTFTNKSKTTMVISSVNASCGCTTPDWTKDPIPPGGTGFVKATYNAAGVGAFDKSVTVMANVEGGVVMLRIHGEVVQ
ncbi:MAG: DUF1573 domain-containing protein [Cyclobacteriaceae bacterium]|nr:DUF1573 domain-containing protein [Cyclobacteriaceae bacterium]